MSEQHFLSLDLSDVRAALHNEAEATELPSRRGSYSFRWSVSQRLLSSVAMLVAASESATDAAVTESAVADAENFRAFAGDAASALADLTGGFTEGNAEDAAQSSVGLLMNPTRSQEQADVDFAAATVGLSPKEIHFLTQKDPQDLTLGKVSAQIIERNTGLALKQAGGKYSASSLRWVVERALDGAEKALKRPPSPAAAAYLRSRPFKNALSYAGIPFAEFDASYTLALREVIAALEPVFDDANEAAEVEAEAVKQAARENLEAPI